MKRQVKRQGKESKPIVGFYKDHGKTKPITKSVAELNRKKIIQGGHEFKPVTVVSRVRDVSQELEDQVGELHLIQDHLLMLNEQRNQLAAQGQASPVLDRELEKTRERLAVLKCRIRSLGS